MVDPGSVTVTNRHENQVKKTGFLYFPKLCKEYHWHCSESSKLSPKQQTAKFHTDGHKTICPELLYFTGTAIVLTKIYLTLLGSRELRAELPYFNGTAIVINKNISDSFWIARIARKTSLLQWNCYSNKQKYFWLFFDCTYCTQTLLTVNGAAIIVSQNISDSFFIARIARSTYLLFMELL